MRDRTVIAMTGLCTFAALLLILSTAVGTAPLEAARPQVESDLAVVDVEFREAEVLDIYQVLGDLAGWNVVADQSVKGKFSVVLRSTPLTQALDLVAQATGFAYTLVGNTLVVASPQRLSTFAQRDFALLPVLHMAPQMAKNLLEASVPGLAVTLDQQQSTALVTGTADQVKQAQAVLDRYDTPPQTTEFDFIDQPVSEILRTLARSAGINILVEGNMSAKLTIYLKDMPARQAINMVASRTGVLQEETAEGVLVLRPEGTKAPLTAPARSQLVQLKYLAGPNAAEMLSAAFPSLETKVGHDGSFVVIRGLAESLAAGCEFLEWADFPLVRLSGLVQHETGLRAVLEIAGRSYAVQAGQVIDDLLVDSLAPEGVTISKGQRREFLPAGGALR